MVWENGDRNRFFPILHFLINGTHYAIVKVFNRALLQIHVTFVTRFVAGFDMQVNEVLLAEGVECHADFVFVVRIVKTCRALHFGSFKTCVVTNTANEVYGRDDRTRLHLGEFLAQEFHLRTEASAPRPNAIRGILTLLHTAKIDGMILEHLLRTQDKVVDKVCRFLRLGNIGAHHSGAEGLTGNVVRGSAGNALVATLNHEQMAVLNTRVEAHAVVTKSCLKRLDEFVGFFRRNVSRRVILDAVFCDADDVATKGEFTGLEFNTDTCSFERTATFIHFIQIITEHRHIRYLATRMESGRHSHQAPRAPLTCQLVHKGSVSRL